MESKEVSASIDSALFNLGYDNAAKLGVLASYMEALHKSGLADYSDEELSKAESEDLTKPYNGWAVVLYIASRIRHRIATYGY